MAVARQIGMGVLLAVGGAAMAAAPGAPVRGTGPHADSQYAHELFRLKQVDVIKSQSLAATGATAPMWKAELILAQYDELTKDKSKASGVDEEYLAALRAYLKSQDAGGSDGGNGGVDGAWALDHAQFILTKLSQPILMRMEYWANNRKDREQLAPVAELANNLLERAGANLEGQMKQMEAAKPFDEKAYMLKYSAAAEVKYYGAWATYFRAMAMEPAGDAAGGGVGGDRKKLLTQAVEALSDWAVDDTDNGVNFQAYLLRGKAYDEAGEYPKALADFAKVQNEKAPNWVQYQGRYQMVVVNLRANDFRAAQANLDAFKKWIAKDNIEAQLSADMLGYRLAWAAAESKATAPEKKEAEQKALGLLAAIVERDPRFRTLVYQQLAAQLPENAPVAGLLPMQQLAIAYDQSQNQKGDTPESQAHLKAAIEAALAAKGHAMATYGEKVEATFLLGACYAVLNDLPAAVKYNVEFAGLSPKDPRAKAMVDVALQQIGELRKGGSGLTPAVREVANKALALSTGTFGDKQWLYAQARMLEESEKPAEAAAIYDKIGEDDRNYLDARYRLVTMTTEKFSRIEGKGPEADQQKAASELFQACTKFIALLDHPPASAPKEVLEAAKGYRYNIWLIEAATALSPAVKQSDVAIDRLTKLDAASAQLSEGQKASVLRYRIQAYQLAGKPEKALEAVQQYAKANGQDAMNVIRGMALSTVDEIEKVGPKDPVEAKRLAAYAVQLLDPISKAAAAEGKMDNAFEYKLIQADMMMRAGQFKESQDLSVALQKEKEGDIRGYMMEARGMFAEAQAKGDKAEFAKSQDYFTRILARLTPGGEGFWEAWLRIMQSMQGQGGDVTAEIKTRLGDLKGVYGEKFGGERFKDDFGRLALKYNVP